MILRRKSIADPLTLPLTLAEAKRHLRVDLPDDDELISDLIRAAADLIGDRTWSSAYEQTWELILPAFPGSLSRHQSAGIPWVNGYPQAMRLPKGPVASITSVKYRDSDGVLTTIASNQYQTSSRIDAFILAPIAGVEWPAVQSEALEPVVIEYLAGYNGSTRPFPAQIKQASRMLVAHWYENREALIVGTISKELEFSISALCQNVTLWRFNP